MRKVIQFFFIALYTFVGAFVLLEVSLRIFDPIGITYYEATTEYFKAMTPDPDFGYIHTPGYRAKLQDVDVSINDEGFRGPRFEVEKPDPEKRLMILGDSVVFGWGTHQDSIFPALLQQRLASGETPWRVISAGVGSWNTRAEYEFLRKRGAHYDIDILLLVVVANDVEPGSAGLRVMNAGQPETPRVSIAHRVVRRIARYSYAVGTFYHILRQRSTSDTLTDLYEADSTAWQDTRDALDGIVALSRRLEYQLVVFLYGDFKAGFSKAFYETFGDYLTELGVSVHALPEKVYDRQYRNSVVDGHPNAAGHILIEEEIYRVVEPLL